MRATRGFGRKRVSLVLTSIACVGALLAFSGAAASAPEAKRGGLTTIVVNTLPISNGLPLDLGIRRGFFEAQGIRIEKRTLQSGNDIVLALANRNGDIGYVGWVPAMIARTQGIPLVAVAASDVEGTSEGDNWQNILVRNNSTIRTPADLADKTIAVNALKGVGEVMIKAALEKRGVNPNNIRLLALPFPAMRSALQNGQVDAIWTPEPFMSQALNLDNARIVMAPGPVLGRFFPIGAYVAHQQWVRDNPALARRFRTAINQSLAHAQANPNEIREMLPAGTQNVRLPIWSPLADRDQLVTLARYARKYEVISSLPNLALLIPTSVPGGRTVQGLVTNRTIVLRLDGRAVTRLPVGRYTFVVTDSSRTENFRLRGPGVNRATSVRGRGRSTWTVTLRRGTYTLSSSGRPSLRRLIRVR